MVPGLSRAFLTQTSPLPPMRRTPWVHWQRLKATMTTTCEDDGLFPQHGLDEWQAHEAGIGVDHAEAGAPPPHPHSGGGRGG